MTHIITPPHLEDTPQPSPEPLPDWLKFVIGLAIAGLVAYFTSQAKTDAAMSRIEERENNHYAELKDAIGLLREDLRSFRSLR